MRSYRARIKSAQGRINHIYIRGNVLHFTFSTLESEGAGVNRSGHIVPRRRSKPLRGSMIE